MKARRTCSLDQEWVRTFEVGPPERYQGHTLYEVTSKLYPVGFPEASTQITTQKRFSEFQKLHLALQQIHKNLYLKDPFPVLPKASYFHRFDEQVLLERRRHAVELLEFAALHPQLYNSQVFVQFFIIDENDEGGSDESSEWSRNASPFEDAPPKKAQTRQAQLNLSRVVNLRQDGNVMDASSMATALGHDPTPTLVPCAVNAQKSPAVTPTTPEEEMKNLPDYLSEAAEDVSRAVHFEIEENFEESVVCYRNAIGTLLSSVQQDRCLKRQASVKRRIAQYISKAESLVEQRNKRDSSSRMRMRMPMMMSTTGTGSSSSPAVSPVSQSRIPHLDLFGDIKDLKRYKILDVISNKVLRAQSFEDNDQVVIKALQKSSLVFKASKKSLLPIHIPYMVSLKCYYETDDAIFLILDYLPHGQLYDAVRHIFIRNDDETPANAARSDSESELVNTNPSISVIKPSQSFLSNRELMDLDQDEENYEEGHNHNDEDEDEDDLEYVHAKDQDTILCIGQDGIEQIDCTQGGGPMSSSGPQDQNFDFMSDCADEEGEDALDVPKSPSTTQMLLNSQTLLANIDSKLEGDTSTAERVIARLDKLESTIYTHMEGRTFTPNSPFRTRKLTTPLNIRPISRNSNDLGSSDSEPLMSPESPYRSLPLFRTYNFRGPLPIHIIRLWASQLCQVLMSLHARGILVKDLNPRNLLLASNGDLCLTYQCEWVSIDRSIDVMAQQCWYTAPEVQDIQPLGPACDWWSVGVILYEITSGQYFVESYPCGLRLQPPVEFSVSIDPQLVDLITGLLQRDPSQRFSREDIQKHPFFAEIHWRMV
ncbi:ribosomal protein S6 kinase delta-1-like [Tigriopus californicus]|uniref:ribosomal protein S6 kinase delta-1-like n=1 Tax=Tigriopus californicus TaxID=6832 RepID=UPI0027DA211E|nr:ribosomal protein S6 kinase delta-1-like [Tigriopus californicus]